MSTIQCLSLMLQEEGVVRWQLRVLQKAIGEGDAGAYILLGLGLGLGFSERVEKRLVVRHGKNMPKPNFMLFNSHIHCKSPKMLPCGNRSPIDQV